jgi:hypothetical protein
MVVSLYLTGIKTTPSYSHSFVTLPREYHTNYRAKGDGKNFE